jgi:hypothetical protein
MGSELGSDSDGDTANDPADVPIGEAEGDSLRFGMSGGRVDTVLGPLFEGVRYVGVTAKGKLKTLEKKVGVVMTRSVSGSPRFEEIHVARPEEGFPGVDWNEKKFIIF